MSRSTDFDEPEATVQQAPRRWRAAAIRLRWIDEAGRHDEAFESNATLGSAPGVTIRIVHPTVSRLHARIELRDDGPWLVDLDSTNGTSIDGLRVTGALLRDGLAIGLGTVRVEVAIERAKRPTELWPADSFGPLVGRSEVMRELFQRLARIAPLEATTLLTGETGTGKDLVARALHQASPRASRPFVVVDCGAVPESLFESELFGHRRGAFTGADRAHTGAFEAADGGTLFLDEVGELPLSIQPKLLRVLETKTVRPVGEVTHRSVDVRIVAATHRDLAQMVAAGAFREDLFFRLAVLPIQVPPLRARRDDIDLLVMHFLRGDQLPPDALAQLRERPWLGNVRELRNFVERASALGVHEAVQLEPVPKRVPTSLPEPDLDEGYKATRERWIDHLERSFLARLLEAKRWNVSAVAEAMELDRSYVHRLMRKHDLGR